MKTTCDARLLVSVCAAALLSAGSALAAEPTNAEATTTVADIVVTAEAREQSVREVPLAMEAIPPSQIATLGATNVTDLVKVIPGASVVAGFGPGFETVEIRGIAAGQFGDGLVGFYVDDTPFGIPNIQVAPPGGLIDLDRVEAILGPSGTLYGQGSMGGTIRLITKQPNSQSLSGQVFGETSFTEGGAEDYDVGGVINVPLIKDRLAVRVSGEYDDLSGYASVPDQGLKHANPERSSNVRVSALWTPTDTFSVSAFYWNIRDNQDFSNFLTTNNPPTVSGAGGVHGVTDVGMDVYSVTLNWHSPIGDVMSNSSYFNHNIDLVFPFSTPLFGFTFPSLVDDTFKTHQFTEEVRVTSKDDSPVKWLAGVLYRDATIDSDLLENFNLTSIGFGNAAPINAVGPLNSQSWSVYGEVSVPLFDGKLEPLVGLRYYDDHRTFNAFEYATFPRIAGVGVTDSASTTWTSVDPRFNLKYRPSRDGMVYINIAKGFRSGSIQTNDQATAANEALFGTATGPVKSQVNPDSLWTYELGTRWDVADRTLAVEASVYYTDWRDINLDFTLPPANILAVANVGNARIYGFDFGLVWRTPIEGLSLSANGDINDSRMTSVVAGLAAQSNVKVGARIPNVPADNYTLSADYSHPLDWLGGVTGSLHVIYAFRDRQIDPTAMVAGLPFQSGQLNDLTLRAGLKKGNWGVEAFVLNALDDKGPSTIATIPYPLRVGARVTANF